MLVLPVPGGPHRIIDDEPARGDHPADRAVGAGQMFLADDLVERSPAASRSASGAFAGRRLGRVGRDFLVGEQVGHAART